MGTTSTWCELATKHLFFTGKGGVGKTSLACATAVRLADAGKQVLLVSTDPASNLTDVLGAAISAHEPTSIADVPGLFALNIDPAAAAQAYRDRIIGPVRDQLPARVVAQMEEELSGACTTEIAAFDEFTALLINPAVQARFDHIVFDTAPTGHTLRLLKLPRAWSDFLASSAGGASCLGPLAGLDKQRQQYLTAVETLADRGRTSVLLVSRPQRAALREAARTSGELQTLGIANQRLIVNGLMPSTGSDDPLALAMRERDAQALQHLPDALRAMPLHHVALQPLNLVGIAALRGLLGESLLPAQTDGQSLPAPANNLPALRDLVDAIEADGPGLVMVLGKGGVGKTTVAAAVAVELAARGHAVQLTTTDPAAHLAATMESEVERVEVSRIDPQVETERYRQHVLETKGMHLDDQGRALLEEDLRSPCTAEIAVFQAFSRVLREASNKFVVIDTAPTGHTLLLLDATGSYHRDITRHVKDTDRITTPLMQLQDPKRTKMLIVALPETTPVLEAAALQADLRRAGIEPWAWVLSASLAAAGPTDPLLAARAQAERAQIEKVREQFAVRLALTPWVAKEPVGPVALRALCATAAPLEFRLQHSLAP